MRNRPITLILISVLFMISACDVLTGEDSSLPTLVPSPTPIPPTATNLPTATLGERPTLPPEATLATFAQSSASNPDQQAFIRIVHAAPDVPQIDIYAEFLAIATNLGFQQSTQQSGLIEGDYTLRVVPTGNTPQSDPLFETTLSVTGGTSQILLLSGTVDALNLSTFAESNEALDRNQSRLTILHAIPRGPDFIVRESNMDITPLLVFGQQSPPVILSSGRTLLFFQSGDQTVLTHEIDLRERRNHTLLLVGSADDLENLTITEFSTLAPGRAQMRVINASAPIGPIDLYVNRTLFTGDVTFGRTSERQEILIDNYIMEVYRRGETPETSRPLTSSQVNINPDDTVALLVVGEGQTMRLVTYREDLSPTAPNESRIALFNSLDTVPQVRVMIANGSVDDVPDLGYAQTPFVVETESDTLAFVWNQVENGVTTEDIESASEVTFEAGRSYLYLMTGQTDQPLILTDNVGIDESAAASAGGPQAIPTPELATRVRFINASSVRGTLDFQMDEIGIASGIEYGQDSDLIIVEPGPHTLILRANGSGTILANGDVTFDEGSSFSVIAYTSEPNSFALFVVPDFNLILNSTAPHIRVINLSLQDDNPVGVARFASGNLQTVIPDLQTPDPNTRPSVPFDAQEILEGVEPLTFSPVTIMLAGIYDFAVTDSVRNRIVAVISNVEIGEQLHYDIIVVPEIDFVRAATFMLEYPVRSRP